MAINTNKLVEITSNNASWRHFVNNLYESLNISNKSFLPNSNVSSSIKLTMDNGYPEFHTHNKYDNPFSIVNGMIKPIGDFFHLDKLGDVLPSINNILGTAITLNNSFSDQTDKNKKDAIFNPWVQNMKVWTGYDNTRTFNYTFNFRMGKYGLWDAKEEVINPILNLMIPCLPKYINGTATVPPYPHIYKFIQLIGEDIVNTATNVYNNSSKALGSGNWISDEISNADSLYGALTTNLLNLYKSYTYKINFGQGNLIIDNAIIENCTVNLSNDTDNNGYPVSGSITLTFSTVVPFAAGYSSSDMQSIKMFRR